MVSYLFISFHVLKTYRERERDRETRETERNEILYVYRRISNRTGTGRKAARPLLLSLTTGCISQNSQVQLSLSAAFLGNVDLAEAKGMLSEFPP